MKSQYKTKQREDIIAYLSSTGGHHFTAADVCRHFQEQGRPIGTATVYRQLEKLIDEKLNVIKSFMQEAERGTCGEHRVVWKTQVRRQLDKKLFAEEHPEINLDDYMQTSTSRPFKIT